MRKGILFIILVVLQDQLVFSQSIGNGVHANFIWSDNDLFQKDTVCDTTIIQKFILKTNLTIDSIFYPINYQKQYFSCEINKHKFKKGDTGVLTLKFKAISKTDVFSVELYYRKKGKKCYLMNQPVGFEFNENRTSNFSKNRTNSSKGVSYSSADFLLFEENPIDLGEIKSTETLKQVISYKNTGQEPFIPLRAKSSGGGLMTVCSRDTVFPGELGRIELTYKPSSRHKEHYTIRKSFTLIGSYKQQGVRKTIRFNGMAP